MKITLPIIGTISLGEEAAKQDTAQVASIPLPVIDKTYDVLGGFLSFDGGGLSTQTTISRKILKANKDWVYRNNDVIAQEVSAIEFELFSIDLVGGEIEFHQIEDHPLLDLLDRFNSRTTKSDGLYMTQSHKKLTGDAFWLLDKNGQAVDNVFILPPDKIELVLADPTQAGADLIKEYKYVDTIDRKQIIRTYLPDEIIHFKKPNPDNPFRGYGAVEALADAIDTDNITNQTQRNFFEKGAIGNFVLTTESNVTQDQLKRLKAEVQAAYGGAKNAFKAMIFGNGLKPVDIGFSNKDMDFLNLLTWYRDKIMIGFGNTKSSIGIIDDVNRASFEGSLNGWLRGTVKPDMTSIVQTINEFLAPLYGDNLILGFKDPITKDVTADALQAVQLKNAGIIQINEAREMVSLSPIDGGDVFAPSAVPGGTPTSPDAQDPSAGDSPTETPKHFYAKPKTKYDKLPDSLKHFDIEPVLRSRNIYFKKKINKELKNYITPIIRNKIVNGKKTSKVVAKTEDGQFTNDQINEYYEKQIHLVEAFEGQFHDNVMKLLDSVKQQALDNFEHDIKSIRGLKGFMKRKELFDAEDVKTQAQLNLAPILLQEIILAGQEAFKLVGSEDTYMPYKIQDSVRVMIDKFADSMLTTDKTKLASIIEDGIQSGATITEIRDKISSEFGDYTKVQAERITRTEVLRASNMATEDAFIQSGVVEAKQWLVAPDACPICAPLAGKIVKLNGDFYDPDDSGFQDGNPPLHVNCRCQLIPIVKGAASFKQNDSKLLEAMSNKIQDLESQLDKRTKSAKEIMEGRSDDAVYIKTLEKHLGIDE